VNRHLLPRFERLFLAVDQEGDPPLLDIEVLGTNVMNVLASRDEPALFDGEVDDDPRAGRLLGRLDQQGLFACKRIPNDVASMPSLHGAILEPARRDFKRLHAELERTISEFVRVQLAPGSSLPHPLRGLSPRGWRPVSPA
jgi:hypothetical protein